MISVFTPLSRSGNPYIEAAFESLLNQTFKDWEWVVLENNGGTLPEKISKHPQVRRRLLGGEWDKIGELKRLACEMCKGDYLLELDHDDLLHPEALAEAVAALQDADFVSSDVAYFNNADWSPHLFNPAAGWVKNYPAKYQDHDLIAQVSPPLTPQNMRKIEWAPDHFRAWRTQSYWKVGGHDASMAVADDHDLLMRMYLGGYRMRQLPKCLYFYRVHAEQTVSRRNALIHELDWQLYERSIVKLAEKFADQTSSHRINSEGEEIPLKKIDLCGAIDTPEGYTPLDIALGHDLNQPWPLADNSVGLLRAHDAIEHLKNPIHVMNEAYRVLAPGGFFLISVPSTTGPMIRTPAMDGGEYHWVATAGRGATQDPTHVSFWNENSFWYYTREEQARYIRSAGWNGRFQESRLRTHYPSEWHHQHSIPYVEAHVIALKEGYEPYGFVRI